MSTPVYQRIYIKVTGKTSEANTKSLPKGELYGKYTKSWNNTCKPNLHKWEY